MRLPELNRMYAFPSLPEPPPSDGFVILDSGSRELHSRGKGISVSHMHKLASHYKKNAGERVYCVAPDVPIDQMQSMSNFAWWSEIYPTITVCPVVQFGRGADVFDVLSQCEIYGSQKFILVENPKLRADEAEQMQWICQVLREQMGANWIHGLNVGFDPSDIRGWADRGCFDSISSRAFYDSAKRGEKWTIDGGVEQVKSGTIQLAHYNAIIAAQIADYLC